jgi:hypothetical protein
METDQEGGLGSDDEVGAGTGVDEDDDTLDEDGGDDE